MRKMINEHNLTSIFHVLATILFAFLFLASLFITGSNRDDYIDEHIIIEMNSPLRILLILVVFGAVLFLMGKLYDKVLYRCNRNILLGMVCLVSFLLSVYWVGASGTVPQGDQEFICGYASEFNHGDFTGLMRENYMARCMQQLGMVTLLRGLFLLFGDGNYMAYQYFSAILVPVMVLSGYKILRKITINNGKTEIYYLLFAVSCFPMYAYTSFVYGDLSSTAIALLAAWIFLSCLEKFSVLKVIALALTAGIAVQLRRNTLVILIAFGIVAAVKLIQKWNWKVLVTGCSVLIGVLLLQAAVRGLYLEVWDPEAREIPAALYIAMGLHDEEGYAGWYDGYVNDAFTQSGGNAELAKEIAGEDIRRHLGHFAKDPGYMLDFYSEKINSQWQAPMYQCIVMNNKIERQQSRIVQMIYNKEPLGQMIKLYMKAFQLFLYGSILLWLIVHRKEKLNIERYILLIAMFGGFLFSVLWEAKTRYVFPYLIFMLPCFAMGAQEMVNLLSRKVWHPMFEAVGRKRAAESRDQEDAEEEKRA